MRQYAIIALSFLVVSLFSYFVLGEDAVKADSEHYSVVFEKDKVRVIKIQYGPDEKSIMHTDGPMSPPL